MLPFVSFALSSHLFVSFFSVMDTKAVFAALYAVCEENTAFFSGGVKSSQGDAARRLVDVMNQIREHARCLEPVICGFASVYHHFDFDPHIPANGYRSLVKVGSGTPGVWRSDRIPKITPPAPPFLIHLFHPTSYQPMVSHFQGHSILNWFYFAN